MKVKVKVLSVLAILAAVTLFAACGNPFVTNILPERDGITYTVTFDKNHGESTGYKEADPMVKKVVPPARTIDALPKAPERSSHVFLGWYTNKDGIGPEFTASTEVTGDITVYAKWVLGCTVTFYKNEDGAGGTLYTTRSVLESSPTLGVLPEEPTREGFGFGGWYNNLQGTGTRYTGSTVIDTYTDITLYAKWLTGGYYIVTYYTNDDASGGTVHTTHTVETAEGNTVGSLPAQPIRAGYIFQGWNTLASGLGTNFTGTTPVTAHISVYAQWELVPEGSFTVTFDKNGGSKEADPSQKIVTPPATTVGTLPAPPGRAGYSFTGWTTQPGGGTAFTAATTVSANITVYAQWQLLTTGPTTTIVDFENDAIGATYDSTGGYANDQPVNPTVRVVADPANAGQKSLEISSTGYNQAAIISIALPAGKTLNDAESFSFRIRLTNGTLSYKEVQVYAASNPATFEHGGFGNPANSQWAQFAANKLGETETIPELPLNQWNDYSIPISGLNSTLSNLSGTIYLAIGIQHDTDEAITYLLDDITFTFGAPQPPPEPGVPVKVDFENDAIDKNYQYTQGINSPTSVKVVADPAPAGGSTKSLEFTGTSGYNQAAVIPINLPFALNTYKSFTFRFNMKTGSLENKDMMVYVANSADKFIRYGFGNGASEQHQFTNLLLGQVRLTDVKNQWDSYAIAIENPGGEISTLSGTVYIAIGINHNDAITYYLDDITFSSVEPPPPADFPTLVTFEDDAIAKAYGSTRGNNTPEVTVRADPASPALSTKSLRVVTNGGNGSQGYNQAAIIPINLPDALSTYKSLRFKFYQSGGTLLDPQNQPRKINAYVSDSTGTFIQYGFGNPSDNTYQFAANLLGEVEPDYSKTNQWVDYAINFTAGSAISGLTGNVYVAIGINHNTIITYYLDDLTFSKQELNKEPGAALTGTLITSAITASGVDVSGVTIAPANGQSIEYSVSSTGSPGVWQTATHFSGLESETNYIAYARSAANAFYNAGAVVSSNAPFTTLGKANGASLTGPITESQIRYNRIVIDAVAAPSNGQTVEYASSLTNSEPTTGWQDGTTFTGLTFNTTYYIFARAKANNDYKAGTAISASFNTTAYAPPVPPSIVDFEDKTVGDTYNRVTGQGSPASTAAVVADPDTVNHSNGKSLQITSNGWNNGAIIPINLEFALKNYESFTFRYRLATSMPESNRGNGIWVYVTDSPSSLTQNQLGNDNASYTSRLLKNIVPEYSVTNQWVDAEISFIDNNGNSTVLNDIQNLSGDVFLVIGINSQQNITYQLDDLTFNIASNFVPELSISPTAATFDKNTSNVAQYKDIEVTMKYLGGKTLSTITNGGTTLASGTNYTQSDGIVTLPISYLDTLSVGTVPLTFTFSDGTTTETKTFTITIRDTSGTLTKYDFTTLTSMSSIDIKYTNATDISASLPNNANVLRVVKTGNNSAAKFILPFYLGTTDLSDYSSVKLMVKAISGDYGNKRFMVEVTNNETFSSTLGGDSNIGNVQNFNFSTSSFIELSVSRTLSDSAAAAFINTIWIAFSIGGTTNSNPYTIEIQSIELVPKNP